MHSYVNLTWMIIVTSVLAGCQSLDTDNNPGLIPLGITVSEVSNVNLVPAVFQQETVPYVRTGSFKMDIISDGDGRTFTHVFNTYGGKVIFDGECISIEDWFWRILPDQQD